MAAKTPVGSSSSNWLDAVGSTYSRVLDAVVPNTDPYLRTYHFDGTTGHDIDDTDTWTPSGGNSLTGVTDAWFEPTTATTDAVSVTFGSGAFTFQTDGANKTGYLKFRVAN